jgi:uroporphyrinogen-III synthase
MKILVIRKFDEFSRILAEKGWEVINLPLIETKELEDLSDFQAKLEKLENYDGIFLTSRNAAQILAEKFREKKINFGGKVYVLGKRSFDILKTENLDLIFEKEANTAREFLGKIPSENLKNKLFLFIRGEKSLRVVPEFLGKIAAVDETIVYKTEIITAEADKIKSISEKIEKNEIVCACFFSPSAVESFLKQFGAKVLHQIRIATIGTTTAEFLEKRNLKVDFVSSKAAAEDFAAGLIYYFKEI